MIWVYANLTSSCAVAFRNWIGKLCKPLIFPSLHGLLCVCVCVHAWRWVVMARSEVGGLRFVLEYD